ncbi:MAG: 3-methyl-2-oxobutanoate hydroxymethyltransferase [Chlorobi bacterium]|nr:3-methyl-2-oxobutanoate hydroxymethyltransferase [Chlorobiota bacterium]MCI0717310.1 3-methyl-2-oxobutanoate hydroxymethyltransferase [Chlorobiota bacterium]
MADKRTERKKLTTKTLITMKKNGEKIACLTAYDFLMARYLEEAGIDVVLVGDSLGNVVQGNPTTITVTLDEMIYHAKIVKKSIRNALLVVDLPFMSYHVDLKEAVRNCGRVMKETGCDAVKLEGGERIAEVVKHLVKVGIPVMGHLGLTPQSINIFGTYVTRGTDPKEAKQIQKDAKILEEAGCFAVVLEKIPAELAKKVTTSIKIPTIGIGAGINCDGQILVTHDMLGMTEMFRPRFVRRYMDLATEAKDAFRKYIKDVKDKKFPGKGESY